jgi:hypothetical protein
MGNPPSVTLSCWAKMSNLGATNSILFGYFTSGGSSVCLLYLDTAQLVRFNVYVAGGATREVSAIADAKVSNGGWHFYAGTYDGKELAVYVDGVRSSAPFAYAALDWTTLASPKSWYLGFPGSTNSGFGLFQDVRVHNIARSPLWVHEAWRRGMGLYP